VFRCFNLLTKSVEREVLITRLGTSAWAEHDHVICDKFPWAVNVSKHYIGHDGFRSDYCHRLCLCCCGHE